MFKSLHFKSLMLLLSLLVGGGSSVWAEKITDYTNIVSGTQYYIGATTGGTDYYLSVDGSSTSSSIAGTAVTSKANATVFTFAGSGTSWTIQFESGNYLSLKSSKDNGKVQVVEDAATFTASNQSSKIRLTIGSYSIQKNNSGTQFGSYGNTQTDIWLEKAVATPAYVITAQSNNNSYGTVSLSGTTITATPATGYRVSIATPYIVNNGTATVTQNGNTFEVVASSDCTVTINFEARPTISGYTVDFESDLEDYVDWTFTNIGTTNTTITAYRGNKYGANINANGNGVATCSVQTNGPIALPGTFTCYVSKASGNTTASTWTLAVSENGTNWTEVATQAAQSMSLGTWVEFTANLSSYSNVYVRLSYGSSSAIRAVDDISITMRDPNTKITPTVTINATDLTTNDVAGSTDVAAGTLSATVTSGEATITSPAVTWSSSNTGVATVNATTGAVTLIAAGTTTITATFAGNDDYNEASDTYELIVINSYAKGGKNNPYTVAEAIDNTPSSGNVYIRGIVSGFYNTSIVGDGSNYRYYISDDGTTTKQLLVYKGKGLNEATFTDANDLLVGDNVTIYGSLITYQNAPEVASGNYIVSLSRAKQDPTIPTAPVSIAFGSTYTVTGIVGGDAHLTSSIPAVATVDGLVITPVAVGTTTITVATDENTFYNAGSETFELTVTQPAGSSTAPTGSAGGTIFQETFAGCDGTGGSGEDWSGSIASSTFTVGTSSDNSGWVVEHANAADGCAKFGTGKAGGSATTPDLNLEDGVIYTLTFRAAAWNGNSEGTTLSVSADNASIKDANNSEDVSSVTLAKASWTSYTLKITVSNASYPVNVSFSTSDGNNRFFLDDVVIIAPNSPAPVITATLNGSGYATFCSQYPLDFSSATDYTAWKVINVDGTQVKFEKITGSIKGGQGIFLKGENGKTGEITLTSADSSTELQGNLLEGTLAPTYVTADQYYGLSGNQFKKVNAGTVPAGKALLPASEVGSAARLSFVFEDDTTTGISNVNVNADDNWYDLQGRLVETPKKGLYIMNGKKVFVK